MRLSHKIQRQLLREKPYYYSTNAHSSEPTAHARAPTLSWPLIDEKMGEEKLLDGTAEKRREISLHHWDIFRFFFFFFWSGERERPSGLEGVHIHVSVVYCTRRQPRWQQIQLCLVCTVVWDLLTILCVFDWSRNKSEEGFGRRRKISLNVNGE